MSTVVQPFNFHDAEVRTINVDGEPWFVAADVARVLGYGAAKDMTRSLDDDEKGGRLMPTPGGEQAMTVISEPGLFKAIVQRQTGRMVDVALAGRIKEFQRWVTHEVLPAIRRTGMYAVAAAPDLSTGAGVVAMAEQYLAAARALVAAEERIEYLEPRAQVADHILDASGDLSVGDAAKELARAGIEIGQQRLFRYLDQLGWTYFGGDGKRRVKQSAIEAGRLAVLPQSHFHPRTGERVIDAPQVRVTPKGLQYLLNRLLTQPRLEVLAR